MKIIFYILLLFIISFGKSASSKTLDKKECEVCVKVLEKFSNSISEVVKENPKEIEREFEKFCEETTKNNDKENRFCYYVGGLSTSASKIVSAITIPLKNHYPIEKICEKLQKLDSQICELKYDIDFGEFLKNLGDNLAEINASLKKMKVKDLKKVLRNFGVECEGCLEKEEYVKKVKEMIKHEKEL